MFGCVMQTQPDFSPDQPHIVIVTYNINFGMVNPQNVVNFLSEVDADIICLQETHKYWETFLNENLKQQYPYSIYKDFGGAGGIAILSKHQVENVTIVEPNEGWFPAIYSDIQTPIGKVQILNVHLKPPLSEQGSVSVSAYYDTPDLHLKEIQGFLQQIDLNKPLIIAGDFNENENDRAINWLNNQGFTDSLSEYDMYGKTWKWKVFPLITLKNRYDHIIFSDNFHCTGAGVIDINASDHMPVISVLTSKK